MYKKEVTVDIKNGLHARPAAQVVKLASKYKSNIDIEFEGKSINVKSIIGILSAGIKYNSTIIICAEGEDEVQAVDDLVGFILNCEN